jgi:hypothetical protein
MIVSEQAKAKAEGGATAASKGKSTEEKEHATNGNTPPPPLAPVLGYFCVPKELQRLTPAPPTPAHALSSGGASGSSKKRGAAEDAATSSARTAKSARSDCLMAQDDVEPGWTGPYGV